MTHEEHVALQEKTDFTQTEKIFTRIFNEYGYSCEFKQTEQYSHYDMILNVKKNTKTKRYNVEIKTKNIDLDTYDSLPLTTYKYASILDSTKEDETALAIFLVNGEEYYIFNLSELNTCECELRLWRVQSEQLSTKKKNRVEEPTFFIPISLCVYNGII